MLFESNTAKYFIVGVVPLLITTICVQADTINVPDDYATIQAAISAAVEGDEVVVAPGTYQELINLLGKEITLRSSDGPETTVIEGKGFEATAIVCISGETPNTVVDGLTITGAGEFFGGEGGGMRIVEASPTINNCRFLSNVAERGGGMYIEEGNPTVTNCTFDENWARVWGGAAFSEFSDPEFDNCSFVLNEAVSSGGAFYNTDGAPSFANCSFVSNLCSNGSGGGAQHHGGTPVLTDCLFALNNAKDGGGGIADNSSDLTINECAFLQNQADGGGGVSLSGTVMIIGCLFEGNHADQHGGGLSHSGATVVCQDSLFVQNSAGNRGGAAHVHNVDSATTFVHCVFDRNVSLQRGGALYLLLEATVEGCLFTGNTSPLGGAFYVASGHPVINNSTFYDNMADDGGVGFVGHESLIPIVTNSILWANYAAAKTDSFSGDGSPVVSYSAIEGGYEGIGNIGQDPQFLNPEQGDFRLSPMSPCIDAGDNTAVPADVADLDDDGNTSEPTPFDLAGNPRFVDDPETTDTGNGDPPIVDMGAYEFQIEACPADISGDGVVGPADLAIILGNWGPAPPSDPIADLDEDGMVGPADLAIVLGNWGPCE